MRGKTYYVSLIGLFVHFYFNTLPRITVLYLEKKMYNCKINDREPTNQPFHNPKQKVNKSWTNTKFAPKIYLSEFDIALLHWGRVYIISFFFFG